jgi:hypothetical protein
VAGVDQRTALSERAPNYDTHCTNNIPPIGTKALSLITFRQCSLLRRASLLSPPPPPLHLPMQSWAVLAFTCPRRTAPRHPHHRRRRCFAIAAAAPAFTILQSQAAHAIASHWEFVLAYVAASASLGLFLVRVARSHPEHKHRMRVFTKWLVRFAAGMS